MTRTNDEWVRRSPDELLSTFLKGRIVMWIGVAILVHLLFVAVTSVGYIRDWLDPEGAAERKAAMEAKAAEPRPEAAPLTARSNAAPVMVDGEAVPGDRKDAPMVKRVTELPATNEIPKAPTDIGISIEDTNTR